MNIRRVYVMLRNGRKAGNYIAEIVLDGIDGIRSTRDIWVSSWLPIDNDHSQKVASFLSNPNITLVRRMPSNVAVTSICVTSHKLARYLPAPLKNVSQGTLQEAERIGLLKDGKAQFSFFLHRFRKLEFKPLPSMVVDHERILIWYARLNRSKIECTRKTFPITQYDKAIKFYKQHQADKCWEIVEKGKEIRSQRWKAEGRIEDDAKKWKKKRLKEIRDKFAKKSKKIFDKMMEA